MTLDLKVLDLESARRKKSDVSEEKLTAPFMLSILNSSPDCIKMVELNGQVSYMNFNGQCAMEIDDYSNIEGKQWCELWPSASSPLIEEAVSKAKEGTSSRFEALCPTAKGTPKWWDVSVSPIQDASGKVERILSISRDVTEQIEREKRLRASEMQMKEIAAAQGELLGEKERLLKVQDTLMREIDHRVKNSLAMISSLLRMQANSSESEEASNELNDAANRVLTVSRVHEKLYQGVDVTRVKLDDYLKPLCVEIRNAVADVDIELALDVDEVHVPADQAVSLGLITSELLANAMRHAFPQQRGKISIMCKSRGEGLSELIVSDDGVGLEADYDFDAAAGLGMKIVKLYAMQLGGELSHSAPSQNGARFSITF